MDRFFSEVLHMSIAGGMIILAVVLLRLLLKKAPRSIICLLWLLAGMRLVVPFQIESNFSLQPDFSQPISQQQMSETLPEMVPAIPDGVELPDDVHISISDDAVTNIEPTIVRDSTNYFSVVWLLGLCGFIIYGFVAWISVIRRVRNAVIQSEGVWISGGIDTPFVFGLFQPRIYLPVKMPQEIQTYILAHERSHIRRGDHWWKLIGFAVLSVHWFNPLVWLGYFLFNRDIEVVCDENVIKNMDVMDRKRYSAALLSCSVSHSSIAACPVAFAENSVTMRIKSVLNYKKPSFWMVMISIVALMLVSVSLMTCPIKTDPLEQCRQALEFHQSQNTSKTEMRREYITSREPLRPMEITYWSDGDNNLVKWYVNDGKHRNAWLLKTNGESYINGIAPYYPEGNTDYTSWAQTDQIPDSAFVDWLNKLQWDADKITLADTQSTDGYQDITFTVKGEYETNDGGFADVETVTFRLDEDGRLISAKCTTKFLYEDSSSITVTDTSIVSYDEATIRSMIRGRISEISAVYIVT